MGNPATGWLENLRGWRNRPDRDLTIGAEIETLLAQARRASRAVEGLADRWSDLIPMDMRGVARPVAFQRGVLTVEVRDSAARFILDRWLRGGGEAALRGACPGLRRVRLVTPDRGT
jgi:hypothetical protein